MKNKLYQATEHQIQTQLMNYLRIKGFYVMRLNSGKYSIGDGKNRRFVMGQDAGTPDLMAFRLCDNWEQRFPYVALYFIEVKRPGNRPTALQDAKMKELEMYGAKCIIASSIEDVKELAV